jgi:23S rRNA pseudoU1915 N3-methylase RlmH
MTDNLQRLLCFVFFLITSYLMITIMCGIIENEETLSSKFASKMALHMLIVVMNCYQKTVAKNLNKIRFPHELLRICVFKNMYRI